MREEFRDTLAIMLLERIWQLLAKAALQVGKDWTQLFSAIPLGQRLHRIAQLREQIEKGLIAKPLAVHERTVQIKDYTDTVHLSKYPT